MDKMNLKFKYVISHHHLKKLTVMLFFCFLSGFMFAQTTENKTWLRLGSGVSLLGTGDLKIHHFDMELHYKFNRFLAVNSSFTYGYGFNNYSSPVTNMHKGNLNFLFAPFSYDRNYQLEIGGGLTYHHVSSMAVTRRRYVNGEIVEIEYQHELYRSFGYNMILENSFRINEKYRLGLKIFITPYFNGDIHSGLELKCGIKL